MSRWKAAGLHLSISIFIGIVTAILLFGVWYPPPYYRAAGADELMLLLVGVDLAVGPLLTLIVFRPGKWGLRFDLVAIGLLQTAALIYGMGVVLVSRPVFLVAVPDRFVLVAANEISDADLAQGGEPSFRSRSWTGPRLVAAQLPTDLKERNDLVFSGFAGRDLQNLPKYYCDYGKTASQLLANAQPLESLRKKKPESGPVIAHWLGKTGREAGSVAWLPLSARKNDMVVLIDARDASMLQVLPIDPW